VNIDAWLVLLAIASMWGAMFVAREDVLRDATWARLKTELSLWLGKTFGDAVSVETQLTKLRKETGEAVAAHRAGDADELLEEFADMYVCLSTAATLAGITERRWQAAVERKLAVLRTRKWVRLEDGTFQHVPAAKGDA